MNLVAYLFALLAGTLITCQTGSNTQLKKNLGQPLPALIVNYIVGFVAIGLCTLAKRVPIPTAANAADAPWWGWIGGLFGAAYGLTAILLASQMGAATLTALVVTGQLISALTIDHFGWIGFDPHPASWPRIAGCAFMVIGLALISKF
jgi:bacterial/archaeal transporter family-2 protein